MEVALVQLATQALPELPRIPRVTEIPFDSQRKRLSTVHPAGEVFILFCKGAPEVVLDLCDHVETGGETCALSPGVRAAYRQAAEQMAHDGLRVLAFAWRELAEIGDLAGAEEHLTLAGLAGLEDPPRPDVPEAIRRCREAGIRVIMVTGDHPQTGAAIARQIGLIRSENATVMTGEELHRVSDTQLQLALDAPKIVFARLAADQKLRIVRVLQSKREIVAVTGDGVNDAPALKQADIGIAMGRDGTDVAREAADMVLLDDHFASIVAAIEEGRAVYANVRKFLTYILTSNIPELVPYLAYVLFRIPLPLTILQILAIDLGTDLLPALGLGAEKPDASTMQRPPRSRDERLLDWPLLARAYLFLGVMQAGAALAAFFYILTRSGWHFGQPLGPRDEIYRQATTACFSAIVVMQIVNVFICRSERKSAFRTGFFSNHLILAGIATEVALILLIAYTPWGNAIFNTAPIPAATFLFILPFALGMLILEELRKFATRLRAHRNAGRRFRATE